MSETVTPESSPSRPTGGPSRFLRQRRVRLGAVIAVAAVVGVILWQVLGGSSGSKTPTQNTLTRSTTNGAVAVSVADLQALAGESSSPIYWAGPMHGKTYEYTRAAKGRIYVRYLPPGVKIGAKKPYLTIGTYPVQNAYQTTARAAAGKGAVPIGVGAGAVAFYNRADPKSVFFAEKGSNSQVEVYSPSAAEAHRLVAARKIVAVQAGQGAPGNAPRAMTPAQLAALSASLAHPIYWVGPRPGFTYEVSQNARKQVFVRYLPPGTKVGTHRPYLTVGTYPFAQAFSSINAIAVIDPGQSLRLPRGGLAVIDPDKRSIHIAFPGSDYQIEVFDPDPRKVRQIVASGQVKPVR